MWVIFLYVNSTIDFMNSISSNPDFYSNPYYDSYRCRVVKVLLNKLTELLEPIHEVLLHGQLVIIYLDGNVIITAIS